MTAHVPIPLPDVAAWPPLWRQVNEWRGRATDEFARAEIAVSEALIHMAAVPGRGASILFPHPVGQRFAALGQAVGPTGSFTKEGKGVAEALTEWSGFTALRTMLCHGVSTVTVDHRGRWHIMLRLLDLRPGRSAQECMMLDETEAAERLKALHIVRQRLEGRLRTMCNTLGN